jgi:hypothetical protein
LMRAISQQLDHVRKTTAWWGNVVSEFLAAGDSSTGSPFDQRNCASSITTKPESWKLPLPRFIEQLYRHGDS